jgi:hypothetical protein
MPTDDNRGNRRAFLTTVLSLNCVRRESRTRLAQVLSDYEPSAPSFSAIRTKSASEEAPIFCMTCRR